MFLKIHNYAFAIQSVLYAVLATIICHSTLICDTALTSYGISGSFEAEIYLNNENIGHCLVLTNESEEIFLQSSLIQTIIYPQISENKWHIIEASLPHWPLYFTAYAVPEILSIEFIELSQTVQIQIDPSLLKMRDIACDKSKARRIDNSVTLPAYLSGYINLRYSSGVGYYYVPDFETDVEPHNILSNFNLQHANWCFTGAFQLSNCRHNHRFLRDLLWINDLPQKEIRIFVGEFSPPMRGTIQNTNILGIGITKNASFFGRENSLPMRSYAFFLPRPSKVDLYVNEMLYETYHLPAGPHSFRNLPILPGNNRVYMRSSDAMGDQQMEINYFYDPSLLQPGKTEWSTSIGFAQSYRQNTYQWKEPTLSGYYCRGITPYWTAGPYFQTSTRECQLGIENIWLTRYVKATMDISAICLFGNEVQPRCRLSLQNTPETDPAVIWFANLEYLGHRYCLRRTFFSYQDYLNYSNFILFTANFNISRRLFACCMGNLGLNYDVIKHGKSKYGINASISSSITKTISCSLVGYVSSINAFWNRQAGVVLSITWNPTNSNFQGNSAYDSYRQSVMATMSYNKNLGGYRSIGANIGVDHHHNHNAFLGSLNYQGERIEVQGSNYAAYQQTDHGKDIHGRSGFMCATSLVFADGVFGISRPVYDSFIMVKPSGALKEHEVGINPAGENYMASTLGPLPAVLPNVISYNPTTVTIGVRDLPLGYELEQQEYYCFPKYKSGTLIRTKASGLFFAEGRLIRSNETPIATALGYLTLRSDAEQLEFPFFTDREGYFQIVGLKPGIFDIYIYGIDAQNYIEIPLDTPPGVYEIGTIVINQGA